MDNTFKAIPGKAAEIIERKKELFRPSIEAYEEVRNRILGEIIPDYIADHKAMGKEFILEKLEYFAKEARSGYYEVSELPGWHEKLPKDHCQYIPLSDERFLYSSVYTVLTFMSDTFRALNTASIANDNLPHKSQQEVDANPHNTIFAKGGYHLWKYIYHNMIPNSRGRLSSISFFYHKMREDGFIHATGSDFVEWACTNFGADIGQLRSYQESKTEGKIVQYKSALEHLDKRGINPNSET